MNHTYAVITGAADGLGRSFATVCAKAGYHLVLVDLPNKKLNRIAQHLECAFQVKTLVLEINLCALGAAQKIVNLIRNNDLPISLLVNNAGIGMRKLFEDTHEHFITEMIQLNIAAVTQLAWQLIPLMKKHTPAGIINISSIASYYQLPYKSVYAATKALVRSLSLSLRLELKHTGIHVCVVCPGGINSNATQYLISKNTGWLLRQTVMHPDRVAQIALQKAMQGKSLVIPGMLNRIIHFLGKLLPPFLRERIALSTMKMTCTINSKASAIPLAA